MSILRFCWRAVWLLLLLVLGLLAVSCLFPFSTPTFKRWMINHYSAILVALCGVQVRVLGEPVLDRPVLWAANHISWLDIFILNQVRATSFVAKSDIRRWPIIGWLVVGAGTVFIERGHRQAVKSVITQMCQRFEQGGVVGFFPESTTSSGLTVQAFHASLFQAAVSARVGVQPVALRFYQHGARTARFAFTGEQSLMANLYVLLSSSGCTVECEYLDAIPIAEVVENGRVYCAEYTYQAIKQVVEVESTTTLSD